MCETVRVAKSVLERSIKEGIDGYVYFRYYYETVYDYVDFVTCDRSGSRCESTVEKV